MLESVLEMFLRLPLSSILSTASRSERYKMVQGRLSESLFSKPLGALISPKQVPIFMKEPCLDDTLDIGIWLLHPLDMKQ